MDSVAGDPFYGQQVRAVGDNETAIVSRLVERLRGQFE
jgi:hypothetical protein